MYNTEEQIIQQAWETYHGPLPVDNAGETYIPAMPPTFERGFKEGVSYANAQTESVHINESRKTLRLLQEYVQWFENYKPQLWSKFDPFLLQFKTKCEYILKAQQDIL